MRIRRLKLENWRGVEAREIEFADGVTIVEGPNETGKTTLIQALFTLIRTFDNSTARDIKAVQPVGKDVGSSVEADIETGEYRFTYRKTYNRDRGTLLDIAAPRKEQLTGRDAHERAEAMLGETVDLALWEALLVDQGERIAPADIKASASLSHALDEAAGTASIGEEDTDLFDAVQAEYEKYFTLKANKPKFDKEERAYEAAKDRVEAAGAALEAVEADAGKLERLSADARSREQALPELRKSALDYEQRWRQVDRVRSALTLRQKDLDAAANTLEQATQALKDREALVAAIAESEAAIAEAEKAVEPAKERIDAIRRKSENARRALDELKEERAVARERMRLAEADSRHLRSLAEFDALRKLLKDLDAIAAQIDQNASIVAKIAIDSDGLDRLQKAENDLRVCEGRRDVAATRIRITAESEREFEIGDQAQSLQAGESTERRLATRTAIRLPGIAAIEIVPHEAATDLEARVTEARGAFDDLLKTCGVKDREQAASELARKQAAQAELGQAKRREKELLGGTTRAELEQAATRLEEQTADYASSRGADTPLPPSAESADADAAHARHALDGIERTIQDAEQGAEALQTELRSAEAAIRDSELAISGQRATLEDRKSRLAARRREAGDETLDASRTAATRALEEARRSFDEARHQLEALDPERIEALHDNAKAAHERAEEELRKTKTELAIVEDRLEQTQASGRFEALEQARREFDEAENRYASTRRRAEAVRRLWETLNRHRDEARQAYVQPLKEAIESLGRIVFGNDFEVTIGDDWAIESVTRGGMTLPYSEHSVGTKEQLGILTRLAAARIVSRHGGVPLIIDDALGFSDPDRLETMGAAISAAGKECQVIILTCAPGRFTHVGNAAVVGL